MRSPIVYFGGKSDMARKILKRFPPHKIYVEVFGGGASLLFAKIPSSVEIYNDLDSGLVDFFRVLRDPAMFERFHRLAALTPYSREEFYYCRDTWLSCDDLVERVHRWFIIARMSFSGIFGGSWSFAVTASRRQMAKHCSSWLGGIDLLPQIHSRLMRVQIEHRDFRFILSTYDTPETLFYCDPPYISNTRRGGEYKHEMTDDDHTELVNLLLAIKGKAVVSSYFHEIYSLLERAGWARYDYKTSCSAVGRTRASGVQGDGSAKRHVRTETIWISPGAVGQLALF